MDAAAIESDQGWQAGLTLGFRAGSRRTVLAERKRYGPLSVQRPFYPEGPVCHVYLLHPPGGVVGGDRLQIDVELGPQARSLITTPGATKFYRSAAATATQQQHLSITSGASLEWLPQENILFPGAEVRLTTRVDLEDGARLALWDIHCLGRPANDEAFSSGRLDAELAVYRDGQPLLIDRLRASGARGQGAAQLAGQPVTGTLLVSDAAIADREAVRALLPEQGDGYTGVTLIDDLLVVRYLGRSTEQARRLFTASWSAVRPRTIGLAAGEPRIWAT